MSKSDPSVNPNAKPDDEKGAQPGNDDSLRHRSVNSQVEGGQNEDRGEPPEGYPNEKGHRGSTGGPPRGE